MQGKRTFEEFAKPAPGAVGPSSTQEAPDDNLEETGHLLDSQDSFISAWRLETRRNAFNAILSHSSSGSWAGLLSTTNNHAHPEEELGETPATGMELL